jgi:hypothetical protein
MSASTPTIQPSCAKAICFCIFLFAVHSCTNHPHANRASFSDSAKSNGVDSAEGEQRGPYDFDSYKEEGHLDLTNHFVKIVSGHFDSDSSFYSGELFPQRNLLIVRNKKTGMPDTTLMETSDYLNYLNDSWGFTIEELSDSLRFESPLLQINWKGDSDIPMSEFVGYWHDTLRSLFTLDNIVSIRRTDEWTLSGFTQQRDEIVAWGEPDYPFTVSLKDFSVKSNPPPVQYIGWETQTREPVRGYKMTGAKDSIRYTIKKGVRVSVDTFYRAAGRVILILPDSSKFHTRLEEVQLKLQGNDAG